MFGVIARKVHTICVELVVEINYRVRDFEPNIWTKGVHLTHFD